MGSTLKELTTIEMGDKNASILSFRDLAQYNLSPNTASSINVIKER